MTREPSNQRPRRRRQWAAACALAATLAVTGCGAMPRSGPVHKVVEPTTEAQEQPARYTPATPQTGASAQEIVEGFLTAGVGAQDDYAVARQYLTPQLANTWKPDTRVLVYKGEPSTVPRLSDGQYRTSLEVGAERSANGVLEQQPEGTTRVLDFTLTSVDGQWRISEAPDGVIVPFDDFPEIFKAYTLYFFDDDYGRLVPDPRWFAERSTVPTAMVRELLAGPAAHLDGAVTSALPGGATLARSAVPVSDGTASVDLNLAQFDPADVERGKRMEQQLEASLQGVPAVDTVELSINDAPVETSGSDRDEPVREVT
ncbi:GerMN domain-containing protein, partial [Kocuria sp.]|uniref:GerMN domain-containing protein n=1 Tax=Kocuria sp. TaxID=1871328 RepID=UPI00289CCDB6